MLCTTYLYWFRTRQNGLQNNWLLRAYMANIKNKKTLTTHSRCYFPHKRPPLKCVALQKFSKSQKMLYWVVKVLFSSQKTATKCVALQKYSKSQKMYRMHCYTEQQGKPITRSRRGRSYTTLLSTGFSCRSHLTEPLLYLLPRQ